jgi:hypothetical protein
MSQYKRSVPVADGNVAFAKVVQRHYLQQINNLGNQVTMALQCKSYRENQMSHSTFAPKRLTGINSYHIPRSLETAALKKTKTSL